MIPDPGVVRLSQQIPSDTVTPLIPDLTYLVRYDPEQIFSFTVLNMKGLGLLQFLREVIRSENCSQDYKKIETPASGGGVYNLPLSLFNFFFLISFPESLTTIL